MYSAEDSGESESVVPGEDKVEPIEQYVAVQEPGEVGLEAGPNRRSQVDEVGAVSIRLHLNSSNSCIHVSWT